MNKAEHKKDILMKAELLKNNFLSFRNNIGKINFYDNLSDILDDEDNSLFNKKFRPCLIYYVLFLLKEKEYNLNNLLLIYIRKYMSNIFIDTLDYFFKQGGSLKNDEHVFLWILLKYKLTDDFYLLLKNNDFLFDNKNCFLYYRGVNSSTIEDFSSKLLYNEFSFLEWNNFILLFFNPNGMNLLNLSVFLKKEDLPLFIKVFFLKNEIQLFNYQNKLLYNYIIKNKNLSFLKIFINSIINNIEDKHIKYFHSNNLISILDEKINSSYYLNDGLFYNLKNEEKYDLFMISFLFLFLRESFNFKVKNKFFIEDKISYFLKKDIINEELFLIVFNAFSFLDDNFLKNKYTFSPLKYINEFDLINGLKKDKKNNLILNENYHKLLKNIDLIIFILNKSNSLRNKREVQLYQILFKEKYFKIQRPKNKNIKTNEVQFFIDKIREILFFDTNMVDKSNLNDFYDFFIDLKIRKEIFKQPSMTRKKKKRI